MQANDKTLDEVVSNVISRLNEEFEKRNLEIRYMTYDKDLKNLLVGVWEINNLKGNVIEFIVKN